MGTRSISRTYVLTSIVVMAGAQSDAVVWAQDFSVDTNAGDEPPIEAGDFLNRGCVRKFNSMFDFTAFLQDAGAVVEKCLVVQRGRATP